MSTNFHAVPFSFSPNNNDSTNENFHPIFSQFESIGCVWRSERTATRAWNPREKSEAFPPHGDSRDTIFHPRVRERVNVADERRGFTSSDFLLRNESFSFHSHELSQFPVDSRLLERQIPVGSGRQTRAANALSRIRIFIPATWACRLKLVFALQRPPRYLQARLGRGSTVTSKR